MNSEQFLASKNYKVEIYNLQWRKGRLFGVRKPMNGENKYYLAMWVNGSAEYNTEIGREVNEKTYNEAVRIVLAKMNDELAA